MAAVKYPCTREHYRKVLEEIRAAKEELDRQPDHPGLPKGSLRLNSAIAERSQLSAQIAEAWASEDCGTCQVSLPKALVENVRRSRTEVLGLITEAEFESAVSASRRLDGSLDVQAFIACLGDFSPERRLTDAVIAAVESR